MMRRIVLFLILIYLVNLSLSAQDFEQVSSKPSLTFAYNDQELMILHPDGSYSSWVSGVFLPKSKSTDAEYTTIIGTEIYCFKNKILSSTLNKQTIKVDASLSFDSVYSSQYYQNKIWIGTDNGLWTWDKKNLHKVDIGSVYNDQKLKELYVFGDDLWYIINNAAFNWNDNLHPIILNDQIVHIHKAQTGSLKDQFFIQTDRGFFIYKNQELKKLYIPEIGQIDSVITIVEDENTLYLTDRKLGIISWDLRQYQYTQHSTKFFEAQEINDIYIGRYGGLWVATDQGVYRKTIHLNLENQIPTLSIQSCTLDGKLVAPDAIPAIEDGAIFSVELEITHWIHHKDILTEYRTQENQQWTSIGSQKYLNYKIKPADNHIQFRSSIDGKNYDYSSLINFHVQDQTWMIYLYTLIGLLAFLFLIGFLALSKNKITIDKLKRDAQSLRLENKALKHEQKALQLQMNPHFLFNALNSIQGLISLGENKKARQSLKQFSLLMRQVLDHSRVDYISIRDEKNYLTRYVELEQMIREDSFDFEINIDPQISQYSEIEPMLIQPFIENAIIHGVAPLKDRRGHIKLEICLDQTSDDLCMVTISDNGVGFKMTPKSTHKSVAIQVVKDRLAKYKNSSIIIKNAKADIDMIGTQIIMKMPIFTHD